MATNTYDEFREISNAAGFDQLPPWAELSEPLQAHVFRVLRRLAVARALDGGDTFSTIEVEAGLGEDAALRTFLLTTAVLAAAEGPLPDNERDTIGVTLAERTPASLLTALLDDCWVYRDEQFVAWTPLHAVRPGFDRDDDEDFVRLTEARKAWDEAELADRLDWLGEALTALMGQYMHGTTQPPGSPRKIFADHGLRRSLREAAIADRFSLLSDGAFAAIDAEVHTVDAVQVKLDDDDEGYVRRSQCSAEVFAEWSEGLSSWKPDGGEGETIFARHAGLGLAVAGGSVAAWLRRCAEALLAGEIQEQRQAA